MRPLAQFERNLNDAWLPKFSLTIFGAIKRAETLLAGIGVDMPLLDAQILCSQVLGISRLDVILAGNQELTETQAHAYFILVKRRLCYEPIAYIIGKKEFYGHEFVVNKDCLIPRPDTECVLEAALKFIPKTSNGLLLDLCTGSGAIGLSALLERKNLGLIATDISDTALAIARLNAQELGLTERVSFLKSDLFKALSPDTLFDVIISNPPYIAPKEKNTLSRDVKDFEPHLALFAHDEEGCEFYQQIIASAPFYLKPGGFLVFEMGFGQRESIEKLVSDDFTIVEIFTDLAGIERGIILRKL